MLSEGVGVDIPLIQAQQAWFLVHRGAVLVNSLMSNAAAAGREKAKTIPITSVDTMPDCETQSEGNRHEGWILGGKLAQGSMASPNL